MATTTYSFCHTNQSLDGFLGRHFADYGVNNYQIIPDLGIYYLVSPETFKLITLSLKALFLLLISFLSLKLKKNNSESIYISSAFFIYGILIISPVAWVNYYVLIIPLLFVFVSSLDYANKITKGLFIFGAVCM